MNLKEIVVTYLKDNGYDGLCNEDCGCALDDLICCEEPKPDCEPGYMGPCDCGESCPWHIVETKPRPPAGRG